MNDNKVSRIVDPNAPPIHVKFKPEIARSGLQNKKDGSTGRVHVSVLLHKSSSLPLQLSILYHSQMDIVLLLKSDGSAVLLDMTGSASHPHPYTLWI